MNETMTLTPNQHCNLCNGAGWYEGGPTIQTACPCLRSVTLADAKKYVVNGSFVEWDSLYRRSKPSGNYCPCGCQGRRSELEPVLIMAVPQ